MPFDSWVNNLVCYALICFFISFRSAGALYARTTEVNKKTVVPAKGTTADYFAIRGPQVIENQTGPVNEVPYRENTEYSLSGCG